MNKETVLFALIRCVICGEIVSEEVKTACASPLLEDVYTLAARHDLVHLVGQAVSKLDLPESETLAKCKKAAMAAFVRYMRLENEYQQVCQALEDAQIPFIPLKGAVLRAYYPDPWMRTSCDIDVLVHSEDLERAVDALTEKLSYNQGERTAHDITMHCPSGEHIELHFDLVGRRRANLAYAVLDAVWENTKLLPNHSYQYEMTDAFFYFYHIAHMAKHVEIGGCGIRPFLDLWILDNITSYNEKERDVLLDKGELATFAAAARKLSAQWFSGIADEPLSQQFARFVLDGGVYGTLKNKVTLQQRKMGGKQNYTLSRVFLPYEYLKLDYPVLQKHRFLTPVFHLVRWCRALLNGNVRRAARELKMNATLSGEEDLFANDLLEYIGLNGKI